MRKEKLTRFIEKYNLSGMVDSVLWKVKNNVVFTEFVSDDKTLLGKVFMNEMQIDENEFGIFGTSELIKMLSPLSDEIEMSVVKHQNKGEDKITSIKFKDDVFKVNYVVADPAIIPPPAKIKMLPDFEVSIKITEDFVSKFLKAKNSVSDVNSFAIENSGEEAIFTIGYSTTNTNRISFKIKTENSSDLIPILFSGEQLKNILTSNKDFESGMIKVSAQGLMSVIFKGKDYNSQYYLVKLQND